MGKNVFDSIKIGLASPEMIRSWLKLKAVPKPDDAADALGVALCHAFTSRFGELFAVGNMTRTKGKNADKASVAIIAEAERRNAIKGNKV